MQTKGEKNKRACLQGDGSAANVDLYDSLEMVQYVGSRGTYEAVELVVSAAYGLLSAIGTIRDTAEITKRESWLVKKGWDDIHDADGRAGQADDDRGVLEDDTEQAEESGSAISVGGANGVAALSTTTLC